MITRDNFTGLVLDYNAAIRDNVIDMASGNPDDRRRIDFLDDRLHAVYDAQAARIAELEAQVSAWPSVRECDEERDEGAFIEVAR